MQAFKFFHPFVMLFIVSTITAQKSEKIPSQNRNVTFTENKGQISDQNYNPRPDVLFSGETGGLVYHLKKSGISYQITSVNTWKEKEVDKGTVVKKVPDVITIHRTDINWIESNPKVQVSKVKALPRRMNYYLPSCPEGAMNVKSYGEIFYKDLFEGIDLKLYGKGQNLEYDYIVNPGGDYQNISWTIKGAEKIAIDEEGVLIIQTPSGEIQEKAPVAYQGRKKVKAEWKIKNNIIGFRIGSFDKSLPLVIDPIVAAVKWGTYYGGAASDEGRSTVVDELSNIYLSGETFSTSLIATSGSHQVTKSASSDAFIAKFNANGNLLWSTYYGGSGDELVVSSTLDSTSNLYVCGPTSSTTGMSTTGAYQVSYGGGNLDAYFAKFDSSGTLQWSTYFGGPFFDYAHAASSDGSSIYFAGQTVSNTNIATIGSHQSTHGGSIHDGFLAKFNSNGTADWVTYYGGNGDDHIRGCSNDSDGNIYISGHTNSVNNIATSNGFRNAFTGNPAIDVLAFLVKFNSNGVRQWGTYYGKLGTFAFSCATDKRNSVVIGGTTISSTGIATNRTHQDIIVGGIESYVAKFDSSGGRIWGTYYGGPDDDYLTQCKIDDALNIYGVGRTKSIATIATHGSHQRTHGGDWDGFIFKLDSTGNRNWGTYYGGSGWDILNSLDFDEKDESILMCGSTVSSTGISTPGTHQTTITSTITGEGFLVKMGECFVDSGTYDTTLCTAFTAPSGKRSWKISGTYFDTIGSTIGCDSIVVINLEIDTINKEILQTKNVLLSQDSTATYQWIDCSTNSIITGANNQDFIATKNGNYALILSKLGCSDTTDCLNVTNLGIDNSVEVKIKIHPNPTNSMVTIDFGKLYKDVSIKLMTIQGQTINSWYFEELEETYLKLNTSSGIYVLDVVVNESHSTHRIVVN